MVTGKSAGKPTKPRQKAKKANGSTEPEQQAGAETPPEPPSPGAGHNKPPEISEEQREKLFWQHHVPQYKAALAAKKKADADFKNACKEIKSDGTSIRKIKLVLELNTPEGEARVKADLAEIMEAVKWTGSGIQLAMFDEPDRTPAVDRAFQEGRRASMQNESRKPPYEPSVPQHQKWLEGYAAAQEVIMEGFKPFPPTPIEEAIEQANEG